MNHSSDSQLLRAYAQHRSEPAFAELVGRHVNLVYSAALRMACDPHLAEDITQNVFVALAQNAAPLAERSVLSGWLHRTAQNIAAQTVRAIERRRAREQEAVAMNELLAADTTPAWADIAPHLDAALGELTEPERDAILLRYFERKSAREMAAQLGISDEAAQKRVSRAVEKLRDRFAKRGITAGTGGLVVVISAHAVQAAPVGLALTISAAALAGITATTATILTTTKAIAMTTLQKTIVTATIAVLAGAGIYEARQAAQLRTQVQSLQQQQLPLEEQIQALQHERDRATNQIAMLHDDNERLNRNTAEVLRLRGEIGVLRRQAMQADQQSSTQKKGLIAKAHTPGSYIAKDELANVGYATPEAALETITWAMMHGTYEQVNEGMNPEMLDEELKDPKNRENFEPEQKMMAPIFNGIQIVAKKPLADDKVELKVKYAYDAEAMSKVASHLPPDFLIQPMINVGGQWKIGGSTRGYEASWEEDGQIQLFTP